VRHEVGGAREGAEGDGRGGHHVVSGEARRGTCGGRDTYKLASSIQIGFGWPVAVLLTLPLSSVAMRLGPVLAGPVHSCVSAAGCFAAVCCVKGGGVPRDKLNKLVLVLLCALCARDRASARACERASAQARAGARERVRERE